MRSTNGKLTYSATDLSSHFECSHKVFRDLKVARKEEDRPKVSEIERQILEQRGRTHEARVLQHYRDAGVTIVDLNPPPLTESSAAELHDQTVEAMKSGADVIYQGTLVSGS